MTAVFHKKATRYFLKAAHAPTNDHKVSQDSGMQREMSYDPAPVRSGPQTDPQGPIRVLFVSHDTNMFGAQRTLLTLLSAIDRRVCSPMLLVPYEGPMTRSATELGIPVFVERLVRWVPGVYVSPRGQRLRYLYRFLRTLNPRSRAIERLIAEHGIDLVYTNTVTCVEGAIAAWRTRKPHVWHIHEPILRNSELRPLLPYRLYSMAVDFLSEAIIFCSKALARDYQELSGKAFIVYNGLPFPSVRNRSAARAEVTRKLDIDAGAKLVAVVGGLQPRKDHLTFLAAAEQVARRVEDAAFLIVGTGFESYTDLIHQRVSALQLDSRVRLLGWWKGDIHDFLAAIDVLVISSEQESFGLTAIEALAMETPVVTTRCGGPEEIVADGATGLLVPVKDPRAMADAIMRLLMDPEFARRLGVMGRKYVSEHFGVDRYVQSIQQVIQGAVVLRSKGLA
jgi:glycosyltransferase involved in cell wall biosynthesis